MRSKTAKRILSETPEKVKNKVRIETWWNLIDKENKCLIQLYSSMFGSHEQRQQQLFIIRNGFNFGEIRTKKDENIQLNRIF